MADVDRGDEKKTQQRERRRLQKPRPEADPSKQDRDGRLRRAARGTRSLMSSASRAIQTPRGRKVMGAALAVGGVAVATVLAATGLAPAVGAAMVVTGVVMYIQARGDEKRAAAAGFASQTPQTQRGQSAQMGQNWMPGAAPGMDPRAYPHAQNMQQSMAQQNAAHLQPRDFHQTAFQQPAAQHFAPPRPTPQQERDLQRVSEQWLQEQPLSVHVKLLQEIAAEEARAQSQGQAPQAAYQQPTQHPTQQAPVPNARQYNPQGYSYAPPPGPPPYSSRPGTPAATTQQRKGASPSRGR
ncbi:hypothetical protein [Streptomyces axinellae]|uniref:Uncharacterized protein n=1 Tax=Streptomyces axinellae TaxID=552788 RepID=A0ABN3Q6N6_9ACTN